MVNYGELTPAMHVISVAGVAASVYYAIGKYFQKETSQESEKLKIFDESQKLQKSDETTMDALSRSIEDIVIEEKEEEEIWLQYGIKSKRATTFDPFSSMPLLCCN